MNETSSTNDFSKGSIISHMLELAIPMTLAQLINVLYNIVDRIFIGRIPQNATISLTGLGICFPLITVVIAFANLIGMGGAPLFSIERGKKNNTEAEFILGNSFFLLLFTGIVLTVIGYITKRPMLYLLGASDETYPYANDYISIYLAGSIFVTLSLGLNSFINAQGFAKVGMITVSIGAVINIILDPIFIFKLNMGVKGAALATVISQFCSAAWTFLFLISDKSLFKIKKSRMKPEKNRVKKIIVLGFSGFTMSITNSIVQMAYNVNLKNYGGDIYIAAMTVINSIREVIQMIVNGISSSSQPILGFNYGARQFDRVKQCIRFMSISLTAYTLIMWILLSAFPTFFIKIFNNDPDVLAVAVPSMHIYFFGFFMMALQFSGQSTFTALGKSKNAIFFSIFRKIVIVIPLIYILPKINNLGVTGVLLSEPISNFIGGTACFITMIVTVYKKLN